MSIDVTVGELIDKLSNLPLSKKIYVVCRGDESIGPLMVVDAVDGWDFDEGRDDVVAYIVAEK